MGQEHMGLFYLILVFCGGFLHVAQSAQIREPQPIGIALPMVISFGDSYTSPIELYDAKITVLDVLRGSEAWDLIKGTSHKNRSPEPGFEYIAARIGFEFSARSTPGDKSYNLREDQFTAFSSRGAEYVRPDVQPPEPALNCTLRSGDSTVGWVAFMVASDDAEPFMIFEEDVQTLLRNGAGIRFRLYR